MGTKRVVKDSVLVEWRSCDCLLRIGRSNKRVATRWRAKVFLLHFSDICPCSSVRPRFRHLVILAMVLWNYGPLLFPYFPLHAFLSSFRFFLRFRRTDHGQGSCDRATIPPSTLPASLKHPQLAMSSLDPSSHRVMDDKKRGGKRVGRSSFFAPFPPRVPLSSR